MGKGLGILLPGLPQFLEGRRLEGGGALVLWLGMLVLVALRFPQVVSAPSRGVDGWIALLTLAVTLGGVWLWSFIDIQRGELGDASGSSGDGRRFWERFRQNHMAVVGLAIVVASYLAALLTPFLAAFDPAFQLGFQGGDLSLILAAPSMSHPLGTDQLSRDLLSRILFGARISLSIGLIAVAISVSLGTLLGAVAGYVGGWVDVVVMRFVDMMMALPRVVLLIVLVALFQPSIFLIILALALTQWPSTTRIVRGEVLSLRGREFVEAARALGYSRSRIIIRHILPNAVAPIIVAATLGIGNTIVLEAGLSFLGLGVEPPTPSWGSMVAGGQGYLLDAWWVATFPGLAIVMVVLAFNLVGDGLRDALDPREGEVGRR
jgi:peptide/nickel transport system permease protein